jgi:5-methylcytosine-specific restriction endonuclease McrA
MPTSLARPRTKAFQRQLGRCFYCGLPMWKDHPEKFAQKFGISLHQARRLKCTGEHLHARQDGGTNAQSNVAAACLYCNQGRHRLKNPPSPEAYMKRVRQKMARGQWHGSWVFESFLVTKKKLAL